MRSMTLLALIVLSGVALAQQDAGTVPPSTAQSTSTAAVLADKDITAELAHTTLGTPERPIAVISTTKGVFRCVLFPHEAPMAVENFIGLAQGTKAWKDPATGFPKHNVPLFTATIFHRVIPNFMIQGGDPLGTGEGDPGYSFKDEFSPDLEFDRPGRLAMANSGPNTNGSQFFITEVPTPHLDGKHTIFGQCDNVELVQQIAREPRDPSNDRPEDPVSITHIGFEGLPKPAPAAEKEKSSPSRKSTSAQKSKTGGSQPH